MWKGLKKSKFSKISLEKSNFFTWIHDLPKFQTRLTPLDILSTYAVPNHNLLGLLSMFKYIVLANLGPFRTFSRAALDTPVHPWSFLNSWNKVSRINFHLAAWSYFLAPWFPLSSLDSSALYLSTDINECDSEISACHPNQECINSFGSYRCAGQCEPGFRRSSTSQNCEGMDGLGEIGEWLDGTGWVSGWVHIRRWEDETGLVDGWM